MAVEPTAAAIQADRDYILQTYAKPDFVIERGEGVYLYDTAGRRYLDFVAGIAVNALGYGDPEVTQAIADQAANALNLYREVFGTDYPFGKLDLVNDPATLPLYGQSPASIVYLGSLVFRGEGMLGTATADSDTTKFIKDVVAHETAHQWWGSLVTNANDRNYWFVESLAERPGLRVTAGYGATHG